MVCLSTYFLIFSPIFRPTCPGSYQYNHTFSDYITILVLLSLFYMENSTYAFLTLSLGKYAHQTSLWMPSCHNSYQGKDEWARPPSAHANMHNYIQDYIQVTKQFNITKNLIKHTDKIFHTLSSKWANGGLSEVWELLNEPIWHLASLFLQVWYEP